MDLATIVTSYAAALVGGLTVGVFAVVATLLYGRR